MMNNRTIFEKQKLNSKSILSKFVTIELLLLFSAILGFTFYMIQFSGTEKPIIGFVIIILAIRLLITIILTILKIKSNVYCIEIGHNQIKFKYNIWNTDQATVWPLSATDIELNELKNYKGFFVGMEINFKNVIENKKLKLREEIWNYEDFENIYVKFKELKKEVISENEINAFNQLQIMNETLKTA